MTNNFDAVILVTGSRWDQDYSSASISLAKELSKETPVYFIDNPFTLKDVLTGWRTPQIKRRLKALLFGQSIYTKIVSANENWIAVTPFVVMPINWLPEGILFRFFSRLNNIIFNQTIRRVIREKKLKRFIFFNSYNPFYGYQLPEDIIPDINIYQSRDNIKESEYVKKHGPPLEILAARSADIRLATSTDLVSILSTDEFPFVFFPNAADVDLFGKVLRDDFKPCEDFKDIRRPVIGYMGNICLRIDYQLLYKIANTFKDCTLLMVGPRNDKGQHSFNFEELGNVIFVGAKKINELPKYLALMNCAILPFKKNALTRSIYPLKINEYLAGGKPVVTTSFSPDIESFKELIYISNSHEEFLKSVKLALEEKDSDFKEKRYMEAKMNSWKVRALQFWQLVADFKST